MPPYRKKVDHVVERSVWDIFWRIVDGGVSRKGSKRIASSDVCDLKEKSTNFLSNTSLHQKRNLLFYWWRMQDRLVEKGEIEFVLCSARHVLANAAANYNLTFIAGTIINNTFEHYAASKPSVATRAINQAYDKLMEFDSFAKTQALFPLSAQSRLISKLTSKKAATKAASTTPKKSRTTRPDSSEPRP